ncbi:hypothetical protein D3C78_1254780 [compost metagenome]
MDGNAAANQQYIFRAQAAKRFTDPVLLLRRPVRVDGYLDDWHIRLREHMLHHRPRAVIKSAFLIIRYGYAFVDQQLSNFLSYLDRASRRIFNLIELIGKAIKIINRFIFIILRGNSHDLRLPMGCKNNNSVRL